MIELLYERRGSDSTWYIFCFGFALPFSLKRPKKNYIHCLCELRKSKVNKRETVLLKIHPVLKKTDLSYSPLPLLHQRHQRRKILAGILVTHPIIYGRQLSE